MMRREAWPRRAREANKVRWGEGIGGDRRGSRDPGSSAALSPPSLGAAHYACILLGRRRSGGLKKCPQPAEHSGGEGGTTGRESAELAESARGPAQTGRPPVCWRLAHRQARGMGRGWAHLPHLARWPCWPLRGAKSLVRKRKEREELPAGVSSPQHLPGAFPHAQVTDW